MDPVHKQLLLRQLCSIENSILIAQTAINTVLDDLQAVEIHRNRLISGIRGSVMQMEEVRKDILDQLNNIRG